MIGVGIIGYRGRMGAALERHIEGLADMQVTGRLEAGEDVAAFLLHPPDVAVDLSTGPAVDEHGPLIGAAGIPYIIGATGIAEATLGELERLAGDHAPVLVVPNFSIGASLMIAFAARAARLMQDPVITERHHKGKRDAPSGTALYTAQAIAAARREAGTSARVAGAESLPAYGMEAEGIRIHSLRGDGYLAEQQVLLNLPGETLELSHRSIDRKCFMEGITLAIRNIHKLSGYNLGLGAVLEL